MADEKNKARILADGIEVWCTYDKLVKVDELTFTHKHRSCPKLGAVVIKQSIIIATKLQPIVKSQLLRD